MKLASRALIAFFVLLMRPTRVLFTEGERVRDVAEGLLDVVGGAERPTGQVLPPRTHMRCHRVSGRIR